MSDGLRYMNQSEINWFLDRHVSAIALVRPDPILVASGHSCRQGHFCFQLEGPRWFVFPQPKGGVFWRPEVGALASECGNIFALGEDLIFNPGATVLGQSLHVCADPLAWLQHGRDGLVVLKWSWAFEQLRDVPRIAVDERVVGAYRRHMRPPSMPALSVIRTRRASREAA